MSNAMGQIIVDAQRMASRIKELDTLGSALLVEAEGNNRLVESLRQFQDDMDSLNRICNNKSNAEMVNRIQQQNAHSSEILKENRELKVCIEDCERALEMVMQKYREHTTSKVLESKLNFREVYNEKLWKIIREQREKISEMAAVMQRAAAVDEDAINRELEMVTRLRLENKTLRELLQFSALNGVQAANAQAALGQQLHEKAIQTEEVVIGTGEEIEDEDDEDDEDELSLSGASMENANNNSVVHLNNISETISPPPPPPPAQPSSAPRDHEHVCKSTAPANEATAGVTETATAAVADSTAGNNNAPPAALGSACPCDNNNGPSGGGVERTTEAAVGAASAGVDGGSEMTAAVPSRKSELKSHGATTTAVPIKAAASAT